LTARTRIFAEGVRPRIVADTGTTKKALSISKMGRAFFSFIEQLSAGIRGSEHSATIRVRAVATGARSRTRTA
jgi:hypothetical protein